MRWKPVVESTRNEGDHEEPSPSKSAKFQFASKPSLEPYVVKLERFELFSTNQCYYLVGCNKQNTAYRVLKMDRTMIERPVELESETTQNKNARSNRISLAEGQRSGISASSDIPTDQLSDNSHTAKPTLRPLSDFLTEDPNVYSQDEIKNMLEMIHDGNRVSRADGKPEVVNRGSGLSPIVKAYGVVGFIRFLDCYYLTLTTRRAKVGSIGDNTIYTIKNTETIPLKPAERRRGGEDGADPSSVLLSMWNRGKRSVGLGLTNREIAELRYQGLYQVVDLTKNFFFSYTYDMTRSLQENFLSTTTKPFPPTPLKDMYSWNYFLTREFENCLSSTTSYQWIMPIIHGAFDQRKLNDYGRNLNVTLLARRSRHFAGTRYLKRGVSEQGKVANDVEYEQILHDESVSVPGSFASFLQVRGSIPTFWTQESSVTMPKPPIELNRVDPSYAATQLHFGDLLKRYSSPILVLDLVKQSEKREREVRVGNEFRHAIDYINHSIDRAHKIRYCALDYSHISKHRNLDVSYALNEVATWAVNQTGFFCSDPKWKIIKGGAVVPFTEVDEVDSRVLSERLGAPIFSMEQNGVLRTNCIDCLDRTNVAQFSAGVEAVAQQLVVMGIRSQCKLGPSSSFVRVLIDLYVDIGDSIALQYGGSEAHKKVTAGVSESIAGPIGKHKELLTSIRRYYSNAFTDRLKQDAMNLFLGYYVPFRHTVPLWEMENDYYLHNFHVVNRRNCAVLKTIEPAFCDGRDNLLDVMIDGADRDSLTMLLPQHLSQNSAVPRSRSTRQGPFSRESTGTYSWVGESTRVARVRRRCIAQSHSLSSWWKTALRSNLNDRLWGWIEPKPDDPLLLRRFERVYQPEKLSQFDRVFSRVWETPVRRTHAAQHSEGVEGDDSIDFSRVITQDFSFPSSVRRQQPGEKNGLEDISYSDFGKEYGFQPSTASALGLFVQHFDKQCPVSSDVESLSHFTATRTQDPPDEYQRYCETRKDAFLSPDSHRLEEFKRILHDLSLSSDDVAGIGELARSAHIGETVIFGEYCGLDKGVSAISVATALHEQCIALDSASLTGNKLVVERELSRRGFATDRMKKSVADGWKRFTLAEKQYMEVVDAKVSQCLRSELTTAKSLQLYVSEFDGDTTLTAADRIFLQAYQNERKIKHEKSNLNYRPMESSSFVRRAARLGISITPHEHRKAEVLPPLYQSDQKQEVLPDFEQINEDMFAHKDNKFMVFNRAGIDSWSGTHSITKTRHLPGICVDATDFKLATSQYQNTIM